MKTQHQNPKLQLTSAIPTATVSGLTPPGEFWRPAVWGELRSVLSFCASPLTTTCSGILSLYPFYLLPSLKFLLLQKQGREVGEKDLRLLTSVRLFVAASWLLNDRFHAMRCPHGSLRGLP